MYTENQGTSVLIQRYHLYMCLHKGQDTDPQSILIDI